VMKFLFQGYERPGLDHENMDNLVRVLEEKAVAIGSSYEKRQVHARTLRFRSAAIRLATMAAAILVFVTLGLYVSSSFTAGTPWTLDSTIATAERTGAGKAIVKADGGERRVLTSANETVVMEAGTVLEVSGTFMHALTRDKSNVYKLTTGSVAIDHTRGSFKLVTPWASIVPIGTLVRASVSEDTVSIACDSGAITIRPFDKSRIHTLHAGEAITATRSGDAWIVTTDTGSTSDSPAPDTSDQATNPTELADNPASNPASMPAVPDLSGASGVPVLPDDPAQVILSARPSSTAAGEEATKAQFMKLWSAETGLLPAAVTGIAFGSDAVYLYRSVAGGDSILGFAGNDGSILGSTSLGARYEKYAFHGDLAYLVSGTSLSAIKIGSGAVLWKALVGPMGFAELTVEQERVYLPSADGTLYMIDAVTGTILGKIAAGSGLYGKPLVDRDRIAFSTIGKELRYVDETSTAGVWKASVPGGLVGDSPIALGKLIVTEDMVGNILAFGRDDGTLAWSVRTGQAGMATAFGIGVGVLFSLDGKPAMAFEDGSTMTLAGIDGDIIAAENTGTILTSSGLYHLALQDTAAGSGLVGSPTVRTEIRTLRGAIDGGRIAILTVDGRLELWQWMDEK